MTRANARLAHTLIAPTIFFGSLILLIPLLVGVVISFLGLDRRTIREWWTAPFVGLNNFIAGLDPTTAIGSQYFATVGRTAIYVVVVLGVSWALAMAGAVFLNTSFRGRGVLRTLFLAPYAIPTYVGTMAWAFMFNQSDGIVNRLLVDEFHLLPEKPFWLIGENSFFSLIIVSIWSLWPFAFLMLLAALQNLPQDVYEAASLDGASNWKQFWHITLPMLRHANGALLLILGLWLFNQFNVPYVLFGPISPEPALLISPLIYQNSFKLWEFGIGGAMSTILLVVLLGVSVYFIRLVLPKETKKNA